MASTADVIFQVASAVVAAIGLIKSFQADHKANTAAEKANDAGTLAEKNKSHGQATMDVVKELFSFARSHDAQISDLATKVGTAAAMVEGIRGGGASPASTPAANVTVNTGDNAAATETETATDPEPAPTPAPSADDVMEMAAQALLDQLQARRAKAFPPDNGGVTARMGAGLTAGESIPTAAPPGQG